MSAHSDAREAVAKIRGSLEREAIAKHAEILSRLEAAQADLTAAQKARKALVARAEDGILATGAVRIADTAVRDAQGTIDILREALPAAERRIKLAAEAVNELLQEEIGRLGEAAEARATTAVAGLATAQAEFQAAGFYVQQAQDLVGLRRVVDRETWRSIVTDRIAAAKAAQPVCVPV